MNQPPNKVEQYGDFFAEYRRVRDSRGEELLFVTMRRDTVTPDDKIREQGFRIDMDALERFASYEVPKSFYAKPFDRNNPDSVECFKEYTASFHAGTKDGRKISAIHFSFAKEKQGGPVDQDAMWVRHEAVKEFVARGKRYEQELGYFKQWLPLVRVVAIGKPNGIGVAQVLDSVEDYKWAREPAQTQADQSAENVLWPYPFRRRFEVGDQFSVRGPTEGHFGNGKITNAIVRLNLEEELRRMQDLSQQELPRGFRPTR